MCHRSPAQDGTIRWATGSAPLVSDPGKGLVSDTAPGPDGNRGAPPVARPRFSAPLILGTFPCPGVVLKPGLVMSSHAGFGLLSNAPVGYRVCMQTLQQWPFMGQCRQTAGAGVSGPAMPGGECAMSWFRLDLGAADLSDVAADELRAAVRTAWSAAGRPDGFAVYERYESEGRLHCHRVVYFSPGASQVARQWGASACSEPQPWDLSAIAGSAPRVGTRLRGTPGQ